MLALGTMLLLIAATPKENAENKHDRARLSLRLSAGPEFDSNANRSLSISQDDSKSDRLVRLLMDTKLQYNFNKNHRIALAYVVGAKRFQEEGAEDVIVQNLYLSTQHKTPSTIRFESMFRYRQSRMRSILRDYSLARGGVKIGWRPRSNFDLWISGGGNQFVFPHENRLNYSGPYGSAGLYWKPSSYLRWDFFTVYEQQYFEGNALTTITPFGGNQLVATFCDELDRRFHGQCSSQPRFDAFFMGSIRVSYQRLFILGAELQFQSNRSNSVYEDINRVRLSVFGTYEIGLGLMLNVLAAIQYTSEQSLSQNIYQYQPEDDENQNRLTLQLSREIYQSISAILRYELFANAFATNDTAFFRQTVFAGLSFEIDS